MMSFVALFYAFVQYFLMNPILKCILSHSVASTLFFTVQLNKKGVFAVVSSLRNI